MYFEPSYENWGFFIVHLLYTDLLCAKLTCEGLDSRLWIRLNLVGLFLRVIGLLCQTLIVFLIPWRNRVFTVQMSAHLAVTIFEKQLLLYGHCQIYGYVIMLAFYMYIFECSNSNVLALITPKEQQSFLLFEAFESVFFLCLSHWFLLYC